MEIDLPKAWRLQDASSKTLSRLKYCDHIGFDSAMILAANMVGVWRLVCLFLLLLFVLAQSGADFHVLVAPLRLALLVLVWLLLFFSWQSKLSLLSCADGSFHQFVF